MTRGTFILIDDKYIYMSVEFNGDMYFKNGYGNDAVKLLSDVDLVSDFRSMIIEFNKTHHAYSEEDIKHIVKIKIDEFLTEDGYLNFGGEKYFDYWFSDYLFIKNISSRAIAAKNYDNNDISIPLDKVVSLNFGTIVKEKEEEK